MSVPPTYDDGLAEGFAACEALVSAGLQALAEAEAGKAGLSHTTSERLGSTHGIRAACLREMAFAVTTGQFRTAEANEAAGEGK